MATPVGMEENMMEGSKMAYQFSGIIWIVIDKLEFPELATRRQERVRKLFFF